MSISFIDVADVCLTAKIVLIQRTALNVPLLTIIIQLLVLHVLNFVIAVHKVLAKLALMDIMAVVLYVQNVQVY